MKGEHRKELQTNILADRMGRLVQGMKLGHKPTSLVLWVIAGLALATLIFYWYYSTTVRSGRSELWVKVADDINRNDASALDSLDKIADDNPGTMPALVARLQRARLMEEGALEQLYSPTRPSAIKEMIAARQTYQDLKTECALYPVLKQEALLGLARAEESLIGVPNPDDLKAELGDIDRALGYYDQYLQTADQDNPLVKATREHVADLTENRKDVVAWYARQNELADTEAKFRTSSKPGK